MHKHPTCNPVMKGRSLIKQLKVVMTRTLLSGALAVMPLYWND